MFDFSVKFDFLAAFAAAHGVRASAVPFAIFLAAFAAAHIINPRQVPT